MIRTRHSFLRGAGSKLDRRTHARRPDQARYCPVCAGQAEVTTGRRGGSWRCTSCRAQGVLLSDGELAALTAARLPPVPLRYRRDGTRKESAC